MTRTQWISMAVLLLAGLGLAFLAMRNRQPPILPADLDHSGVATTASCMSCHGPNGSMPRKPDHPLGDDCLRCHGTR